MAITITVPAKITIEDDTVVQIDIGGSLVWLGETYIPVPVAYAADIANGASLTAGIDLTTSDQRCARPTGLVLPAEWDAADVTFQVSVDGGVTYYNMYDDADNEYVVQAGASRYVALNPSDFAGVSNVKIRSGTAGTPVNQTGAVTVTLQAAR